MFNTDSITVQQIAGSLLAIPAFLPLTVCTGYLAGWYSNFHGFRHRSLVERLLWSIPLSFAVSTITSVLIGKFLSLTAVVILYFLVLAICAATITAEWFQNRRTHKTWVVGFQPLGSVVSLLAVLWIIVVILSLVDFQRADNLYSSFFLWDQSARINWTEAIIRTGIPPQNSFYFYQHAAPMRNYYFWYVLCATVVRACHLLPRAVFTASCAWSGFALASIIGLYLKHFLCVGTRLRKQFLLGLLLLSITGLDICVNIFEIFYLHQALQLDLEWWSNTVIFSWYGSLMWVPHHVTGLVCCLFAFLLAWISKRENQHNRYVELAFIAAALASAFGISIFVPFGFFLVTIVWALWHLAFEKDRGPVWRMAAGGGLAVVLLSPYLWELARNSSSKHGNAMFAFNVRQMIPVESLTGIGFVKSIAHAHPHLIENLAALVLMAPGYAIELGFYMVVLLVYLIPVLRGNCKLTAEQRCLVVMSLAALCAITFVRSNVLQSNDFGWRAALILQFPLLLLASDMLMNWRLQNANSPALAPFASPRTVQSIARIALTIGVISTITQACMPRFDFPLVESSFRAKHGPQPGIISHNAYISYIGYRELSRSIPADAVVQFNPGNPWAVWKIFDIINVNRQVAIISEHLWCGSELGGDPSGCPAMIAAISPLFKGAPAAQARAVCHTYGIQYLVAKIYDPAWSDSKSWVWTLPPVVSDPEFRALKCTF